MRQTLAFRGSHAEAAHLAACLGEEGLDVSYSGPIEKRAQFSDVAHVFVFYIGAKVLDAVVELGKDALKGSIRRGVAKYRERGGKGQIDEETRRLSDG